MGTERRREAEEEEEEEEDEEEKEEVPGSRLSARPVVARVSAGSRGVPQARVLRA